jgi:RNA polymerase sigma factor (sigma-70 family)
MTSRNDLITQWVPLVYRLARRYRGRIQVADYENLISAGMVGLIHAVDNYDAKRGPIKAYCERRITGAMLDEIRVLTGSRRKYTIVVQRLSTDLMGRPDNTLWREDVRQLVCSGLTAQERIVLLGRFYHGLARQQIGEHIGVSPRRISQILAGVMAKLRVLLEGRKDEFVAPAD